MYSGTTQVTEFRDRVVGQSMPAIPSGECESSLSQNERKLRLEVYLAIWSIHKFRQIQGHCLLPISCEQAFVPITVESQRVTCGVLGSGKEYGPYNPTLTLDD